MNFLRLYKLMVQKINPRPVLGCNRSPPSYYVFQKMQFLEVFRPFFQRSLTYYKFLSRSSSSHTKGKSWASHQLKKMFALLASYFIFAEERPREKRNTIAMVNYTDDGHPERAFFQKLETLGLGQTNWADIL